ncbi:MAG: MBL fold metallo-hydrolase [Candidatus Doudnabacteria bacterium]
MVREKDKFRISQILIMKITKLGHCCMIIEDAGMKILTDPGMYTTEQNVLKDIDIILITHEHGDHLHIESVKAVLANNPDAKVITNSSVGNILSSENIVFETLEDGQSKKFGQILIEGFGTKHAEIFEEYGQVLNTGYFIQNKLFFPGDALYIPPKKVEVLAFPTAGSWANIKESINYVMEVKPVKGFPVHDGGFKSTQFVYGVYKTIIPPKGIEVILPELGKEFEV